MTKANDLASLLDANGDVVSTALDNVPASDLVNDTTPQLGGTLDTNTNDIAFADNDKAIFGAGSDLQIYHDGLNSYVQDTGTGDIIIKGDNVRLQDSAGGNLLVADTNDAVQLYYGYNQKLSTTATGVDVTGDITATHLKIGTTANPSAGGVRVVTNTAGGSFAQYSDSQTNSGFTLGTIAGSGIFYTHTGAVGSETYVERMRLDSSGNLLVGKTSTSTSVVGSAIYSYGTVGATRDGSHAIDLGRNTSDGDIALFRKDGTVVGSIGVVGGHPHIASASGYLGIGGGTGSPFMYSYANALYPTTDNYRDLGTSGNRFKDLYLSGLAQIGDGQNISWGGSYSSGYPTVYASTSSGGYIAFAPNGNAPSTNTVRIVNDGIEFGAASSNLNDYEEGDWNGYLKGVGSDPTTQVVATGQYTKVGRKVYAEIRFSNVSNVGASGTVYVSGLPYASHTAFASSGNCAAYLFDFPNGLTSLSVQVAGTNLYPYISGDSYTWDNLKHAPGTARYLEISAQYTVA